MEQTDCKPYQPLSKIKHEMDLAYTSSSDESEDGRKPRQSFNSRETLHEYNQELRRNYNSQSRKRKEVEKSTQEIEFCETPPTLCSGYQTDMHSVSRHGYQLEIGSDVDTETEGAASPDHALRMWIRGMKSEHSSCLSSRANSALSLTDTDHERKSDGENGFHQDSDLLDRRKHCFTMQSECGEDLYFSVELESDLAQWERAFQTATFLEVERIQCKTYACVLESHLMGLTIDFSTGFICYDAATKAVLWRFKFSQLKGSSDDGKSKIKFLFQNPDTKQIEAKELEFSNLFAVLHCIHSFFAAKVACLDPLFLGSQAVASSAGGSAPTSKAKHLA